MSALDSGKNSAHDVSRRSRTLLAQRSVFQYGVCNFQTQGCRRHVRTCSEHTYITKQGDVRGSNIPTELGHRCRVARSLACTCMTCCILRALARISCRRPSLHGSTWNRAFPYKFFRKLAHTRQSQGLTHLGLGHSQSCNNWQSRHFLLTSNQHEAVSNIAAASSVTASGLMHLAHASVLAA